MPRLGDIVLHSIMILNDNTIIWHTPNINHNCKTDQQYPVHKSIDEPLPIINIIFFDCIILLLIYHHHFYL